MSLNPLQIGSDCNLKRSVFKHAGFVSIPFKSGLTVMLETWCAMLRSAGVSIPFKSGLTVINMERKIQMSKRSQSPSNRV